MRELIKNAMILLSITVLSGVILGSVYQITKAPIEQQQWEAQLKACREVFDLEDTSVNFADVDMETLDNPDEVLEGAGFTGNTVDRVLEVKDGSGTVRGYVLSVVSHEGYGGDISFYMGVTKEGVTRGISILDISETPGLGMRAEEVLKPQFENRSADQFSYTKTGAVSDSEIDAISGATITSKAVTNGVNAGLTYLYLQGLVTPPSQSGANGGAE